MFLRNSQNEFVVRYYSRLLFLLLFFCVRTITRIRNAVSIKPIPICFTPIDATGVAAETAAIGVADGAAEGAEATVANGAEGATVVAGCES